MFNARAPKRHEPESEEGSSAAMTPSYLSLSQLSNIDPRMISTVFVDKAYFHLAACMLRWDAAADDSDEKWKARAADHSQGLPFGASARTWLALRTGGRNFLEKVVQRCRERENGASAFTFRFLACAFAS